MGGGAIIDPVYANIASQSYVDEKISEYEYNLPIATSEQLGGVKIGEHIQVAEDGTISVNGFTTFEYVNGAIDDKAKQLEYTMNEIADDASYARKEVNDLRADVSPNIRDWNDAYEYASEAHVKLDRLPNDLSTILTGTNVKGENGITVKWDSATKTLTISGSALATSINQKADTQAVANLTSTISNFQTVADKAIPKPDAECTNKGAKCVLVVTENGYEWEVVQRKTND